MANQHAKNADGKARRDTQKSWQDEEVEGLPHEMAEAAMFVMCVVMWPLLTLLSTLLGMFPTPASILEPALGLSSVGLSRVNHLSKTSSNDGTQTTDRGGTLIGTWRI